MSIGPCLCGDPYCPSCGNPSQAAFGDALDQLCEDLEEMGLDEHEFVLFVTTGKAAVEAYRNAEKDRKYESLYEPLIEGD